MSDELLNQDLLLDVEGHGRRVGAHDDTNDDDEVEGHARRVG